MEYFSFAAFWSNGQMDRKMYFFNFVSVSGTRPECCNRMR